VDLRSSLLPADTVDALPLWLVTDADYRAWLEARPAAQREWLAAHDFRPERGRLLALPGEGGRPLGVVAGAGTARQATPLDPWFAALLAERLPPGTYALAAPLAPESATRLALGWLLGRYRFARYRNTASPGAAGNPGVGLHTAPPRAQLVAPLGADLRFAEAAAEAMALARDLINTPANDLGPAELADAAAGLAAEFGGHCRIITGEELRVGYPLIEAVGRGSPRAPRLADLRFARPGAPRLVLVGKGVCFDSGGLDIKPSSGMLLMKKDMGGAACALGLALLLRRMDAPVDLRVLVPAVENAVDGHAFRPGDVFRSRKGLTVEIGNTDAEGRLVLADALAAAGEDNPDLIIDLATLTGAARVALGAELPAAFSGNATLAAELVACGHAAADPLWQLPLWDPYDEELGSRIADLGNVSSGGFAGAIIGALFLRRFVPDPQRWLHVDLYAWNAKDRPGRPAGGEAQCIRALYALLRQRWG
jgi:leucyl aminopeptidase